MSTLAEKLAPPTPMREGGARATLSQIYKMWGEPEVTKRDETGMPTELTRHELEGKLEVWERIGGITNRDTLFEKKVEE